MCAVTACILFSSVVIQARDEVRWGLDRDNVNVGGCVTLVMSHAERSKSVHRLMIQFDESAPVRIATVGPIIREKGRTIVLLSHRLLDKEGVERLHGEESRIRVHPLFKTTGTMGITLLRGSESLGTRKINVQAASARAQLCFKFLYPEFDASDGLAENRGKAEWLYLLAGLSEDGGCSISPEDLSRFQKQVADFEGHPDWSEVATMAVSFARARSNLSIARMERTPLSQRTQAVPDSVPDPRPELLQREFDSRFARALQRRTREMIAERDRIRSQTTERQRSKNTKRP